MSTERVLLDERSPPQERPDQAVIVLLVRTMFDGIRASARVPEVIWDAGRFGIRARAIVPVVILFALRLVSCEPFPLNAQVNLSETTFMVHVVAFI